MKLVRNIAFVLVIIGAINAGLWGFLQLDLLGDMLGGPYSTLARTVFALIGLGGVYCIWYAYKKCCKKKK